jgi:phosphoribosylformylglycinamidine synthase subunit PurS
VDDLHGVPPLAATSDPVTSSCQRATERRSAGSLASVPRVVVDVVPKPEILDPQGQAIVRALPRLGVHGVRDVRQGKHFELDVDEDVDAETLHRIAGELLANPVIENWTVRRL